MTRTDYLQALIYRSDIDIKKTLSVIDVIDMNNYDLKTDEQKLIHQITESVYNSRKAIELDINFEAKLSKLKDVNLDLLLANKPMIKSMMANFLIQPINRVIYFAQQITDFTKLDRDDQLGLIREGSIEMTICSASLLYDNISNQFFNKNMKSDDNNNQPFISLDKISSIWGQELLIKTISYLKSMNQLGLDETSRMLYLMLILFSPNRRGLRNPNLISQLQAKYAFLLKKYIISKHDEEKSIKLYGELMEKLNDLTILQDMHKDFLLDCDQSKLDLLLKEILIK